MLNVSSIRVTIPKATAGEIFRRGLVETVLGSPQKTAYIHGGAGYGKTTLLAQIANAKEHTVWLTLDGENDLFSFLHIWGEAIRRPFPDYGFTSSEYLPFEKNNNFITILANALLSSIEELAADLMIILDDLHTADDPRVKQLITCVIKYKPENVRLCFGSRVAPWQDLMPLRLKGNILELTQRELAFTRDEAGQVLSCDGENIYRLTEGWPIAVGTFKVLLENGVSLGDIPAQGPEALYSYLFYECVGRLPAETVNFLRTTSCFAGLDTQMLDAVLDQKNTRLMLESLASRNIFTIKIGTGQYRYHSLFRDFLLEDVEVAEKIYLQTKAIHYYFNNNEYAKAARYAILSKNTAMLQRIILASYRDYIRSGNFGELRVWFKALDNFCAISDREVLLARGIFLSSIGNFSEAKACLEQAIPLLSAGAHKELFIEAMAHKARVLRNYASFEESNQLLDELLSGMDDLSPDHQYTVAIEKIYNLCWNSQIKEAYATAEKMIEACARAGAVKTKAWFERYLTAVHFFAGRMKDAVYCYEKSLALPEQERRYLDMHSIGMYAAKAYQMLGDQNEAVSLISTEIQKLRSTGRYEELWAAYLIAAEIHYHLADLDRRNGGSATYATAEKYFTLGIEYAPLYRTSKYQLEWAKMQRLVYSLIFTGRAKAPIIEEILSDLENIGDYLRTIVLGRLYAYYLSVSDYPNAVKYAWLSIETGERANMMMIPTIAYGILAGTTIAAGDKAQAVRLTAHYLRLCSENGIYDYFRMQKTYGTILEFALDHGIELDFVKEIMALAGYQTKKAYIKTLGGFSVLPFENRQKPLKMRAKKERELLAFLLDAGSEGVTKEQIYNAIWSESESKDIKRLIGVNLTHIKKDLAALGLKNPIVNYEKHYSICRDAITLDADLFEAAVEEFKLQSSKEAAQKVLSLYQGEYLADFEAFWAVGKRIKYREAYEEAMNFLKSLRSITEVIF